MIRSAPITTINSKKKKNNNNNNNNNLKPRSHLNLPHVDQTGLKNKKSKLRAIGKDITRMKGVSIPYKTRSKTRNAAMHSANVPNPKAPCANDPAFIDLSDRIGGGNVGASGGDIRQGDSNNLPGNQDRITGAVPKQHKELQITHSVGVPTPTLTFPHPPSTNNSDANLVSSNSLTNARDFRNELAPVLKEMVAEVKNTLLKEMRDSLPGLSRTTGAEMESSWFGNRSRNRNNKRARHNSSIDSFNSGRSGELHRNNNINQNHTNRNNYGAMSHSAAYACAFAEPPPPRQPPIAGAGIPAAVSEVARPASGREKNKEISKSEINIEKWGINYQGHRDSMSIEDFLFRLEYLKEQYVCSWGEILRDFHRLLGGEAREWYWLYIRSHGKVD
ncbi:probable basic-leucine zipper transcription factor E [Rhagoletis pomonella]|uniref:probable basic-leucine zipper transcription factor E n=1 Tax=Rhagoletis pomonella TaxID=28610 RepID=UPI001783A665|nr:probable basic-leucine zipper transcription factor E [Rhagoletis pomonella]